MKENWTIEDSKKLYNIENWGDGYFTISENGNLAVNPYKKETPIEIVKVIEEMRSQNVALPAVIRFHDVLRSQVERINHTFANIIADANYLGKFTGVYPIKVNQMREVVEEIIEAGEEYNYGLEAGSKPELLAVLAYNTNPNAPTILNGYKDEDYLKLALMGMKLGRKVIIVIEKFSELPKLLKLSKQYNIKPQVGFRGKMSIKSQGKWAGSSGDRAKFGLTIAEMVKAVDLMREHDYLDCIKLFHFHIGSQISDICTIKAAINEAARIYTQLYKLGCKLEYFDAGGGLGVDYDGSRSRSDSSINYTLTEYVSDIVYGLKQICDIAEVPHPNIVTESGRAITAHHSCVVTNVVDQITVSKDLLETSEPLENESIIVTNMREVDAWEVKESNYQEIYNEAIQLKEQGLSAFNLGVLSLIERAALETLFWKTMKRLFMFSQTLESIPEAFLTLEKELAPQYLCNFSIFQSAADSWAIDQILPVLPLTRHQEYPSVNCSIADITCDSDGKIDKFINSEGFQTVMPVHELKQDEEYLMGLFLTGAYQDVMGDMHNLFGRLNEVHVYADADDAQGFYIEEIIKGGSSSHVLSTMQYNPEYMAQRLKKSFTKLVSKNEIAPREGVKWVDFYEDCLTDYTYLSDK
jgi:arginine decarboxylase